MARLLLLSNPKVRKAVRIAESAPNALDPWLVFWRSRELPRGEVARLRSKIHERWGYATVAPDAFAIPAADMRQWLDETLPSKEADVGFPSWYPASRMPDPGFLLLLTAPSRPGLVAIGRTTENPGDGDHDFGSTGIPERLRVAWRSGLLARHGQAAHELESTLHLHRVSHPKGFFRIEAAEVMPYCRAVARQFVPRVDGAQMAADFLAWFESTIGLQRLPKEATASLIHALMDSRELNAEEKAAIRFFSRGIS